MEEPIQPYNIIYRQKGRIHNDCWPTLDGRSSDYRHPNDVVKTNISPKR